MKNTIESVRKEQNVNQETLARAVGVSRQTIISIERGKCTPSVSIALRIAQFLGKTVEELFAEDGYAFWILSPASNENYRVNSALPFDGGLICGQKRCADFVYGNFSLAFNGGEIIAVYNALLLGGREASLADLILEFEENRLAMLGGFAGTDPKKIGLYLSAHGIAFDTFSAERELSAALGKRDRAVMIYSYIDIKCPLEKRGLRTVAAVKQNGSLRVYNMSANDTKETEFASFASLAKGKMMLAGYVLN